VMEERQHYSSSARSFQSTSSQITARSRQIVGEVIPSSSMRASFRSL
jgi:hypothetical protein